MLLNSVQKISAAIWVLITSLSRSQADTVENCIRKRIVLQLPDICQSSIAEIINLANQPCFAINVWSVTSVMSGGYFNDSDDDNTEDITLVFTEEDVGWLPNVPGVTLVFRLL